MITTIIDPVKVSREDGQVTFPPSLLTSCKNLNGFIFLLLSNGRSEGTRTPNPRFWRPVLYQLSYTPKVSSTLEYRDFFNKSIEEIFLKGEQTEEHWIKIGNGIPLNEIIPWRM